MAEGKDLTQKLAEAQGDIKVAIDGEGRGWGWPGGVGEMG